MTLGAGPMPKTREQMIIRHGQAHESRHAGSTAADDRESTSFPEGTPPVGGGVRPGWQAGKNSGIGGPSRRIGHRRSPPWLQGIAREKGTADSVPRGPGGEASAEPTNALLRNALYSAKGERINHCYTSYERAALLLIGHAAGLVNLFPLESYDALICT